MKMENLRECLSLGENMWILKIAFSRYFKNHDLDMQSGEMAMLLTMLEKGSIKCGSYSFSSVKTLPDKVETEVKRLAEILRKKSYVRSLRHVLHVFSEYRYDLSQLNNKVLYYSKLKLCVSIDYLSPRTLLCLLAELNCKQVAVFTRMAKWDHENHYLLFERSGSWKEFSRFAKT
jgi:hypothetical protein